MSKLNKRQELMLQGYQAFRGSARGMVTMFEDQLQGYWGPDNRDSQWLEFFVNMLGDTPQLQKNIISLIPRYTGCTVSRDNGVFVVVNNKDLTKKQKETYRAKIGALIAAEWPTIQDIDKPVKEEKDKKAIDTAKKFRVASKAAILDGYSPQQLLAMMQEMALEAAQEVEAEELAAENEAALELQVVESNEIAALEAHVEAA
ncbi:MAG: hypothetical protein JKY81_02505 [Colwellia sp.]|nr:hypothetical protein [Colwellia sp.]